MKSIGLARLGRDAEMRHTQDGTAVANLALAYNYGRKGQDGKQPTQWVEGSLWGKRAEALTQYLTKGTAIVVTLSELHIETFNKQDGTPGSALKARIEDLEFAGGNKQSGGSDSPEPRQPRDYPQPEGGDDSDESIPF